MFCWRKIKKSLKNKNLPLAESWRKKIFAIFIFCRWWSPRRRWFRQTRLKSWKTERNDSALSNLHLGHLFSSVRECWSDMVPCPKLELQLHEPQLQQRQVSMQRGNSKSRGHSTAKGRGGQLADEMPDRTSARSHESKFESRPGRIPHTLRMRLGGLGAVRILTCDESRRHRDVGDRHGWQKRQEAVDQRVVRRLGRAFPHTSTRHPRANFKRRRRPLQSSAKPSKLVDSQLEKFCQHIRLVFSRAAESRIPRNSRHAKFGRSAGRFVPMERRVEGDQFVLQRVAVVAVEPFP